MSPYTKRARARRRQSTPRTTRNRFRAAFAFFRNANMIVLASILVLSVAYVVQVNSVATKGFVMTDLERQQSALIEQNQKLEIESSRLRSLSTIRTSRAVSGLVETTDIDYLEPGGGSVAQAP